MTIKVHGNYGPGARSHGGGIGGPNISQQSIGWVGVTASAAGDIAYIDSNTATGAVEPRLGYTFQSTVSVTLDFTLTNAAQACSRDPNVISKLAVPWINATTVAAGTAYTLPHGFSALRATFSAPGELYIVAR